MGRPRLKLTLNDREYRFLEKNVKSVTASKRDSLRSQIILLRAAGYGQKQVAEKLGINSCTVAKWTSRFRKQRLDGLKDKSGRGRKPGIKLKIIEKIIIDAGKTPPRGYNIWSIRLMARTVGVSRKVVHETWKKNDIKPHRIRLFKISNDPNFIEKFWDIVNLYLNPPKNSMVLCCDEKSQCQALERSQPGLPLGVGYIKTKTHDYTRHGTTTLFAALDYVSGKIIHRTEARHRTVEWLRFLKQIDRETPKELTLHLIVDNYCTHKNKLVKKWLKKHPRFVIHFTPTSSSWLNMVERFFADITRDVIRSGSFKSVRQLEKDIKTYITYRNESPVPYVWRAEGAEILRKIERAKAVMAA